MARIQHDITVITDESIITGIIERCAIHFAACCCLLQNAMNKIVSKSQLEIQIGLTCLQLLGNHLEKVLVDRDRQALVYSYRLKANGRIPLGKTFRFSRTDGIKFLRDIHNIYLLIYIWLCEKIAEPYMSLLF